MLLTLTDIVVTILSLGLLSWLPINCSFRCCLSYRIFDCIALSTCTKPKANPQTDSELLNLISPFKIQLISRVMADPTESTTHGLYLSGNFHIEKQTSQNNGWRKEWRTFSASIWCSGAGRSKRLSYDIDAKGFGPAERKLEPGNIYFLRGAFFPTNDLDIKDVFYFEGSDRGLILTATEFSGDLADTVGATGVGIVKDPKQFTVQYRIPPTPNLLGTPKILRVGLNPQANKVCPTTGNKEYDVNMKDGKVKVKEETNKPVGLANKPMKFEPRSLTSPFKSPIIPTDTESASSMPFAPSDFGPSSFSRASSSKSTLPSGSSASPEKAALEPSPKPVKKRALAQPKRSTKKSKTLDLTLNEEDEDEAIV
ncbi:uncharacterized protein MELLADRAFT_84467 [Melampsora larici-populina 98AG31]|uniref:Uncharacterized protein n=1 Tax=Melampsora larici-populina (strain 98AG31 / pathotype 3-4-7) TaxID=747676 RepID=F4SC35_MELLP|nr:uncharacterized protein MELLADRAFT_84467 [Melampsora larici-populina 98AG31]EGF97782.1 hypothetical protein MELLADRAFT_84467 [Melampsora larici-populina 98AG31]